MSKYELDKNEGPHAASRLTDQELEYLHRITSLEMAIRMDREAYTKHFKNVAEARMEINEMIEMLRKDRDRICFVAAVQADLKNLPLTTDAGDTDVYGLYL